MADLVTFWLRTDFYFMEVELGNNTLNSTYSKKKTTEFTFLLI